jgi:translocation and assembly module TamB
LLVRKLQLGDGAFALESTAPFELRVHEGALAMERAALEGPKLALGLSAEGSLQQEPRLVLSGTAVASLFSGATQPLAEAFGDVDVRLEWSPSAQPSVRGEAKLRDVLVKLEAGAYVHKLHGKLLLAGERVQLEGVGAELGGGALSFEGALQLHGTHVSSYDLALKADEVAFEPQPRLEVTLDADTHLSWQGGSAPPKLAGALRVKRVLYLRHIQLPEALTALNRQDRTNQATYAPARDRLAFDLAIEQQGELRVRNNFLDAELEVRGADHTLRVVGSDQRFGILGKLAITRGRVLYRGDEFQVARGEVSFDDEHRVAPTFEVRAVSEKRKRPDTSVVLLAHGTRDTFNMTVRCDAGAAGGEPRPFSCDYVHDDLRCDTFERLVQQWLCRAKPERSAAETTR